MSSDDWSLVANFITALCAIGALGVASQGLFLWRKQLYGTDDYHIAKQMIGALLQVRMALEYFLFPGFVHIQSVDYVSTKLETAMRLWADARQAEQILKDDKRYDLPLASLDFELFNINVRLQHQNLEEARLKEMAEETIVQVDRLIAQYRGLVYPPNGPMGRQ